MVIYNLNTGVSFEVYSGYDDRDTAQVVDSLVSALIQSRCYAFVGAGVSMRAGLPNWKVFIERLAEQYRIDKTHDNALISGYISRGDLITAAELIKNSSDMRKAEFHSIAAQLFRSKLPQQPSDSRINHGSASPDDVHRFITRTAFEKIITTNYDNLLREASVEAKIIEHKYLTRNANNFQTQSEIAALVSSSPAVVGIHGTCEAPESMIITRKDYLDAYSGGFLMHWLRTNLIHKSFLFVGYSLSDFDIVNLIKKAKATLPSNVTFGPHFAILDSRETSPAHRAYLKDCYQIQTIADNIRDDPAVLRKLFAFIHGMYALRRARSESLNTRPPETLTSIVESATAKIRSEIGCDYIEIYLAEGIDQLTLSRLCRRIGTDEIRPLLIDRSDANKPPQELRKLFLNMRDVNYFYTPSASTDLLVSFAIPDLRGQRIKSVVVIPVSSQGKKIGLLVAGSVIEGAFTSHHYDALTVHAKSLADSYKSVLSKIVLVNTALKDLNFDEVTQKLGTSRLLASLIKSGRMRCILYAVDYVRGRLIPHFDPRSDKLVSGRPSRWTQTFWRATL